MVKTRFLSKALLALACGGILIPMSASAAEPAPRATKPAAPRSIVSDVTLTEKGSLAGKVVDGQGRPLDGAKVVVRQGNRDVAKTMTDKTGSFSVPNVKGGVYQIAAGEGTGTYRVWTANAAPPSAKPGALVVSSKEVVRGQIGGGGALLGVGGLAAGGAGLGLGAYSVQQANNAQDDAEQAQQQNQQLQNQVNQLRASVQ